MFTSAATVTPLYKALSTDFHKTMDFYAARDTKVGPEAMKEFGVEKVPALVVLDGAKTVIYDGAYSTLIPDLDACMRRIARWTVWAPRARGASGGAQR